MRLLLSINDRLADLLGYVAGALVLVIFFLVVGEIISRTVFSISSRFSWEYIGYLNGAVIFLGLAYTQKMGGHIRLKIVSDSLNPEASRFLDLLCTIFAIGMVGYLTWALGYHAYSSWASGSLAATAMRTPLYLPQGILAVGAFFLLLQLLARLTRIALNEKTDADDSDAGAEGEYAVKAHGTD